MSPIFSIQIPEPCHENWAEMKPSEQGRFCQNCQKIVVDFSKMSDRDLTQWFAARAGERVCGRVNPKQLNRSFSCVTQSKSTFYQRTAILVSGLFFATSAYGQDYKPTEITTTGDTILVHPPQYAEPPKTEKKARILRGVVLDEGGEPIPYACAIVNFKDKRIGAKTDDSGKFELDVSEISDDRVSFKLEIFSVGFNNLEIPINDNSFKQELQIQLQGSVLGEMIITEIKPKTFFGKVGYAIKKPFKKLGRAIKGLFNN